MLYELLRGVARAALRFYYADVYVVGREHIPHHEPTLVVANHPNALVDAMLVATTLERRVFITARGTLFETRLLSAFLGRLGVIPLMRAQDVASMEVAADFRTRNQDARARVADVLKNCMPVLVFPEGISHDGPAMAPLRSGAARLALQARESGVTNLQILPIGLVYETKEKPDTAVCVHIGAPVDVDAWYLETATRTSADLTREIARRLQRVSIEYPSRDGLARAEVLTGALGVLQARVTSQESPGRSPERSSSNDIIAVARALQKAPPHLLARVATLVNEVDAHAGRGTLKQPRQHDAARAAYPHDWRGLARDVSFVMPLSLFAFLGKAMSAGLRRIARFAALQSLRNDPSRDQPAMRTILIALVLFPLCCALLLVAFALYLGVAHALIALSVALSAIVIHLHYRDRLWAASQRISRHFVQRTYNAADACLSARVWLDEASAIERELRQLIE